MAPVPRRWQSLKLPAMAKVVEFEALKILQELKETCESGKVSFLLSYGYVFFVVVIYSRSSCCFVISSNMPVFVFIKLVDSIRKADGK
jgi:hypothetical protein